MTEQRMSYKSYCGNVGDKKRPEKWLYPMDRRLYLIQSGGLFLYPYGMKPPRLAELREYSDLGFPGSENGRKPNDQDDLCKPDKGSSSGSKAKEPMIVAPFYKSSSDPGNQDNATKRLTRIFESEARRRSMWQIKPEFRQGNCKVCFLDDDHITTQCPYLDFLPENAIVSSGCDLTCNFCGKLDGNCNCRKEQGQRVDLKICHLCFKLGEHRADGCPLRASRQT